MKGILEERAVRLGEYIIEHQSTVRDTALVFGVSKSTVHKDITTLLPKLNAGLFKEVRAVLDAKGMGLYRAYIKQFGRSPKEDLLPSNIVNEENYKLLL